MKKHPKSYYRLRDRIYRVIFNYIREWQINASIEAKVLADIIMEKAFFERRTNS